VGEEHGGGDGQCVVLQSCLFVGELREFRGDVPLNVES
jgi:hypothetical protein